MSLAGSGDVHVARPFSIRAPSSIEEPVAEADASGGDVKRHAVSDLCATTACAGICALVVLMPFEATRPLLRLPGQSVTVTEGVLFAVLAAVAAAPLRTRALPSWRTPLTIPFAGLWVALLAAALVAGEFRANALHMAARMGIAGIVYLVTVVGTASRPNIRKVLNAAVISGAIVGLLIVLEYVGVPPVREALHVFKPAIATVGAHVRASGPMQYPTIASMYLEILFALGLGVLLTAIDEHRGILQTASLLFTVLVMSQAITATFTRAGVISALISLFIVGVFRYRRFGFDTGTRVLAAILAVIAIQNSTSRSLEALSLRFTTEGESDWYLAVVDAPLQLDASPGESVNVPVKVTNMGRVTWDSAATPPIRFSYHWVNAGDDRVVRWEGVRTDFLRPVAPEESVVLQARVEAPPNPGRYRLVWDLEQEGRRWFSTEPGARPSVSEAIVKGLPVARKWSEQGRPTIWPSAVVRPGRLVLWTAAAKMLAAHPVFGVGPDNFRLLYGSYIGRPNADPRLHSNNMYVEVIAGGGVVAGVLLLFVVWRVSRLCSTLVSGSLDPSFETTSAGVLAAVVAIGVHGLVDSFLGFTATYVLFAVALGLAVSCTAQGLSHANRV